MRADVARERIASARTLLFVPGDRPERFAKAAASGADLVVLDLEDAVRPERRADARAHVAAWLDGDSDVVVRINGVTTADHAADVALLAGRGVATMLAKADSRAAVESAAAALGADVPVIALVESAAGILAAAQIAAHASVVRLAFGSIDYAAELGIASHAWDAMLFARGALVVASAAAGIASPIDGVTTEFASPDRTAEDAAAGRRIGFTGKLCIHPAQVAPTHSALLPTAAEVAWARRVLAEAGGGAAGVRGEMVDPPVLLRARRILEDSGAV